MLVHYDLTVISHGEIFRQALCENGVNLPLQWVEYPIFKHIHTVIVLECVPKVSKGGEGQIINIHFCYCVMVSEENIFVNLGSSSKRKVSVGPCEPICVVGRL